MGIMQIDNASPMSIGFSVVVVIIAALNLVLDFDFIEEGAEKELPNTWNGMCFWPFGYADMALP